MVRRTRGLHSDRYRPILGDGRLRHFRSREDAIAAIKKRWPKATAEGSTGLELTWQSKGYGSREPFYEGMVAHMVAERWPDSDGPQWVRFHQDGWKGGDADHGGPGLTRFGKADAIVVATGGDDDPAEGR